MKKLLFGTMLLALVIVVPISTMADVNISIGIPLPPLIVFAGPIEVIVIPDTYVYVIPDIEEDIFFYGGWWWRPWEGRWYRSRYYDRDWVHYRYIPYFYYDIDFGWRGYYRDHHWYGRPWNYGRIPYQHLQQNWRGWQDNRYWERERKWDVENHQPPTPQKRQELRRERQNEYARKPEVQKEWRKGQQQQPQQRQPQVQKPQQQPQQRQPQQRQPQQPRQQQPQQPRQQQPQRQGEPEGGKAGQKK